MSKDITDTAIRKAARFGNVKEQPYVYRCGNTVCVVTSIATIGEKLGGKVYTHVCSSSGMARNMEASLNVAPAVLREVDDVPKMLAWLESELQAEQRMVRP